MAIALIRALRHSYRNSSKMMMTSTEPMNRALVRFSIAISMKVAGRKIVLSTTMPSRPGASWARVSSTPLVTSRVFAQGSFSTISMSPSPSLITASPLRGWKPRFTSAMSPRRMGAPSGELPTTTLLSWSAVTIGRVCRTPSRWLGVSTAPPVPTRVPLTCLRRPASRDVDVTVIASSSVTPLACSAAGSTLTKIISRRWPHIATLATPGTPSSRARTFQYAVIERSIIDISSDDNPIFITLLVAESGWMITGGAAQLGRVGWIVASRSWTSWRASIRSVPGSKMSSTDESWVTDFDRITSRRGTPWRFCSSGTVMSSSTSPALRPMHAVCTSTRGGANSGNTSTDVSRICVPPRVMSARAAATARKR